MVALAGKNKLGLDADEPVTVVLADDGAIIDDADYLRCIPADTKLIVLCQGESKLLNITFWRI